MHLKEEHLRVGGGWKWPKIVSSSGFWY